MENPLDMLSRAASMIETTDMYNRGDVSYKRVSDRDSPSKHLPSKILKSDHVRERSDLVPASVPYSSDRFSNKCSSSTQTAYPSFPTDQYHPADPRSHMTPHLTCLTSSPNFLHTYPPMSSKTHKSVPLNLSSGNISPNRSQGNPSHKRSSSHGFASPLRNLAVADIHDPIEEHFRRSLGKNYPECISNKSSRSTSPNSPDSPFTTQFTYVNALTSSLTEPSYPSSPPAPQYHHMNRRYGELTPLHDSRDSQHSEDASFIRRDAASIYNSGHSIPQTHSTPPKLIELSSVRQPNQNVTTLATESVDDHFAKSLGDQMWSQLKVNGSVDDHFHKALGDTWLRIKAETEPPNDTHLLRPVIS